MCRKAEGWARPEGRARRGEYQNGYSCRCASGLIRPGDCRLSVHNSREGRDDVEDCETIAFACWCPSPVQDVRMPFWYELETNRAAIPLGRPELYRESGSNAGNLRFFGPRMWRKGGKFYLKRDTIAPLVTPKTPALGQFTRIFASFYPLLPDQAWVSRSSPLLGARVADRGGGRTQVMTLPRRDA